MTSFVPNVHEKNREGLDDFGDVMNMVCDDAHRATAHTCGYSMIIHSNARHHKPRPLRHQNRPGLPVVLGRPGYEATS